MSHVIENKKARYNFQIIDTLEAGLLLQGSEVKSLRDKKVSLDEAYVSIVKGKILLLGAYINEYSHSNQFNHQPTQARQLLLHKKEVEKWKVEISQKGYTLVPLKIYFKGSWAKILIGLAKGKKNFDKRQDEKKKQAARQMNRLASQFRL